MPAIFLSLRYHGPVEGYPKDGIELEPTETPLIIPDGQGGIYLVAMRIGPTQKEKEAIAKALEAQQRKLGNPVKVEVEDVREKDIPGGKETEIAIKVIPIEETKKAEVKKDEKTINVKLE